MKTKTIDKRNLEIALLDQKKEFDHWTGKKLCARYEESLVDLDSPQAQVVIGVRRSGKSTLCLQSLSHAGVNFAYVDFDDERLAGLSAQQLNDVLEVLYMIYGDFNHIFLDEIQNIEGWPLFVNRLLRTNIHVVLTGSNAKLLSSDLATHLTGRSNEIHLYPLSYTEFCAIKVVDYKDRTTEGIAKQRNAFDSFLETGGFPELTLIRNSKNYIIHLVDNILKRDIEQRYRIASPAQFENLAHHLLNMSPCRVSPSDLANTFLFKSPNTVRNYIAYLKQAYLLIGVNKYSTKSKVRITQEKLYAVDVALMNQRENVMAGENLGWRLETMVLIHLIRKNQREGWDVYYLHERSGECDFIVCNGNKILQCIQVSYDISNPKTLNREINGLLLAHKRTNCSNLLLLTDHDCRDIEKNGVRIAVRPVYEWCTE